MRLIIKQDRSIASVSKQMDMQTLYSFISRDLIFGLFFFQFLYVFITIILEIRKKRTHTKEKKKQWLHQ